MKKKIIFLLIFAIALFSVGSLQVNNKSRLDVVSSNSQVEKNALSPQKAKMFNNEEEVMDADKETIFSQTVSNDNSTIEENCSDVINFTSQPEESNLPVQENATQNDEVSSVSSVQNENIISTDGKDTIFNDISTQGQIETSNNSVIENEDNTATTDNETTASDENSENIENENENAVKDTEISDVEKGFFEKYPELKSEKSERILDKCMALYPNLSDEQYKELLEVRKYDGWFYFPYKEAVIVGQIDSNFSRMTLDDVKKIIEENKNSDFDSIVEKLSNIQPPDKMGGSGTTRAQFFLDDDGKERIIAVYDDGENDRQILYYHSGEYEPLYMEEIKR